MIFAQAMQQAVALQSRGRLAEAEPLYRLALKQAPDNPHAMNYLGAVLVALGQKEEGLKFLRKSIYADPSNASFSINLATSLIACNDMPAAESAARQAIRLNPRDPVSRITLSHALWQQSKREEAIAELRSAIELQPANSDAQSRLGLHLLEMGRASEAVTPLSQALRLQPNADSHANLGSAMIATGNFDAAAGLFRRAIALQPGKAEYHYNLGLALSSARQPQEAVAPARRAVELRGDFLDARQLLADSLRESQQLDEALAAYQAALAQRPDHIPLLHGRSLVLAGMGRVREAGAMLRRLLAISPNDVVANSALLFFSNFHPDYDAQRILHEHLEWNRRLVQPLADSIAPYENERILDRRLRIGYVSPDLRDHVLSFYHLPLLSHHDHSSFEVFCYSDVLRPDATTQLIRACADTWRETPELSEDLLAQQICADRIDILVDLTMHMANGRPLLFARKPAPVQVQWCYPGTTGNQQISYRLTDPFLDPHGQFDEDYSEKSIRLPDTFFIYDPRSDQPTVNDLRALTAGHVTFGCLNNFTKVNEETVALWARVLHAVANSHLLLLAPVGSSRQRVIEQLQSSGIEANRIEFVDRQSRPQYLATYHRIDISLDTIPYNGHTTSMDSCWMGVPVVTLIGKTVVGRAGWSLCCNLGLRDLAAKTPEEFVEIAARLAGDLPALAELRKTLRPRMQASPLMDGAKFAKGVETVYRQIWKKWCGGI